MSKQYNYDNSVPVNLQSDIKDESLCTKAWGRVVPMCVSRPL
jgi:hypothetical protein